MSAPERPVFNDRYEIHSRIGRGGMADVFLARDRLLDRPVAVKVLFPEYATDPSFVERFRREAQAAANLNHPNIVGVYDWGRQSGTYFIVMEYVNGRTLADLLKADGPVPAQRACDIAFDVAGALGFAHRNGVGHRDVKPGNILVAPTGAVKVADFGIARALSSTEADLTQAGAVMGTATYFSPEQAQGANPDPRSDLYSLGIVMYEMAAGKPPFSGENPVAIAYRHVHDAAQPLSALRPDTPKGYEAITMKLLAKSPANRYASAEDLRADLKRFRDGQQPVALSPTSGTDLTTMTPASRVPPPPGAAATTVVRAQPTEVVRAQPPATRVQPAQVIQPRSIPSMQDAVNDAYGRRPRRAGWVVPVIVLAIAGLLVGGIALWKSLNKKDVVPTETVTLLDFQGKDLPSAKASVISLNLIPIEQPQVRTDVPVGQVFDQDPKPGSIVDKASKVTLIYNPGPGTVPVPNLVGATEDAARAALAAAGLAVVVTPQESDTAPLGQVLSQDPLNKTEIAPGGKVTIVVSAGKGKAEVPNLFGQDVVLASQQLGAKGFTVTTEQQPSESLPVGKVIATDPAAGTQAEKGSAVKLIVSAGAAPVAVPQVEGLTESQARDKLQAAGFQQKVSQQDVPFGSALDGKVMTQSPAAGENVPKGATITLIVGKALPPPPPTIPPTVATPPPTIAKTTTVATSPPTTK